MRTVLSALMVVTFLGCSIPEFHSRADDTTSQPDSGSVTPTDDVTIPTDDVTIPTDDVTIPTDDVTIPTDDVTISPTDVPTPPTDVPTPPTDVPTPPTDVPHGQIPTWISNALPPFDTATIARVRQLRASGATRGNRLAVFAKIGDSITEAASFLSDVGNGWYTLGAYEWLIPTIQYFSRTSLGDFNSFDRPSSCAMGGWVSAQALDGDPDSPLRRELNAIHPAYAIVMLGTNDIDRAGGVGTLQPNLTRIAQIIEDFGTVPILSTIPDRLDNSTAAMGVAPINTAIRALASTRHLPIIDYWLALQHLPRHGVSADGIHPSVYVTMGDSRGGDFTDSGLQSGYNVRNLTAILMLDRLRSLQ